MKPAPFIYLRPTSVDELLEMLQATRDTGKLLAGGQSLVALLNLRMARPGHLIDMNFVGGLSGIDECDGGLRIGTMTRQRDLELHPLAAEHAPLAVEALHHVAHVQIRHRGTVGGNLAHADPASELPAVMRALDATFVARGPDGERRIPAQDFFMGLFTTTLREDELLAAIEVPSRPADAGWSFKEFSRRRGDFALAGAAVQLTVDGGHIVEPRVCLSGVSGTPHRAVAAEERLAGTGIDDTDALREACRAAVEGLEPSGDLEAPPAYRLALAEELTRRAVRRAAERATV